MASKSETGKQVPYNKRIIKQAPIVQSRDTVKDRRRDLFLKKVQQDRDDRRWTSRGDQIQRLDFISGHKRWEAEKAKQALNIEVDLEDVIAEDSPSAGQNMIWSQQSLKVPSQQRQRQIDEEEVDYILEQEYHELDALVSAMEENNDDPPDYSSQHYGSDDEDYDKLFSDYLAVEDTQDPKTAPDDFSNRMDAMDTS